MTERIVIELTKATTTRTPEQFFMISAESCELLGISQQDVYGDFTLSTDSSWLKRFEAEVAVHLGLEDALFMPSGVMAANIVFASVRSRGSKFICHYTSHTLLHEKNAYSELLGMTAVTVPPKVGSTVQQPPLSYADVESLLDAPVAPSLLVVELPHREIGGKCSPWVDLLQMSAHCRRNGVHFHCDGARLWEAEAAYGRPLLEICALFDTVYVSFYKGLGGVTGAMLLGRAPFIEQSRVWLRRFGGNVYSQMPFAVSCWAGYRANKGTFHTRRDRMVEVVARLTEEFVNSSGSGSSGSGCEGERPSLLRFDPPVPEVSLVHVHVAASAALCLRASEAATAASGVRCFARIREVERAERVEGATEARSSYFEFSMGPQNMAIGLEVWVAGWAAFLVELRRLLKAE